MFKTQTSSFVTVKNSKVNDELIVSKEPRNEWKKIDNLWEFPLKGNTENCFIFITQKNKI